MVIEKMSEWVSALPLDTALWIVVLIFIAFDVILGTANAWSKKELSSSVARKGVMHKMGFIAAMLLCNIIDIAQSVADFGYSVPTTILCAVMIVACEVMSICEHIRDMNPDIKLDFLNKETKTTNTQSTKTETLTIKVEGMDELVKSTKAIEKEVKK